MGDPSLRSHLHDVIHRVDERIRRAPGSYDDDAHHVRHAAARVLELCDRLPLGTFVSAVGPERSKPQFLLLFEQDDGRRVVLKVYGKPRRAEALVQSAWHRHGVQVVHVLDAGDDPTSWLVLEAVTTTPIVPGGLHTRSQLAHLSGELAAELGSAHRVGARLLDRREVPVTDLQNLDVTVGHHLDVALSALTRHGYSVRRDWRALGTSTFAGPGTVLHGDLSVGNVIRKAADGALLLLDTCGYTGPAEFDAARWSARTGGAGNARFILESWLAVEPRLDPTDAYSCLALELVMEAGVRELVKEERGKPWGTADRVTEGLVHSAEEVAASIT